MKTKAPPDVCDRYDPEKGVFTAVNRVADGETVMVEFDDGLAPFDFSPFEPSVW